LKESTSGENLSELSEEGKMLFGEVSLMFSIKSNNNIMYLVPYT